MMLKRALVAVASVLMLAACSSTPSSSPSNTGPLQQYDSSATTINIVAGSEQQSVLDQIVVPWCQSQGLTCNYELKGSVDQARLVASGNAPYDAFWFASSVFEQLGDQNHQLQSVQPMFITPIVFAGYKSEMQRLGFVDKDVTIQDVLQAVETKKTTVWVTNPTQSNSGATVLFGFMNYFAGNGPSQALTAEQLNSDKVQSGITRFVRGFDQTPPSTGTMMNDCLAHPDLCKTMFTYEDLVIEKNQELVKAGKEPLYAVYPQGSLAISDAPLGFMPHGDNQPKLANFKKLQDYLLSDDAQQKLLQLGRRPVSSFGLSLPNAPADVFNPSWGIKPTLNEQPITYPAASVIETALDNYQTTYRTPVNAVYCIDGSGSMAENDGWNQVTEADKLLFDPSQAKLYLLQINPKDRTSVIIFNDGIKAGPWIVDGNKDSDLLGLKQNILDQGPGGGTGIYRCLGVAAQQFSSSPNDAHKRLVILMTDGQDNVGENGELDRLAAMNIPVIAIGFGSADSGTLQDIANRTGGTYIAAKNDLVKALRQATGYK